ncbi:TetR/AcrR family transcriptional regulator [Isoptericola hypogeus]|uniref:TetR/AcrR family transcriptional regulator n=1 Tax=Isoptericola hypogeus TaxID=300179 RepID=A0ABN2IQX5_9MICO
MNLRERRRADTMRAVQRVALDLFERRGYDAVSIAQIAAEAQVAERTVYRHFGTKEMLVVHDELDAAFIGDVVRRATTVGAIAGVREALAAVPPEAWRGEGAEAGGWLRKMRLLRATPSLHATFERATSTLGDALGAAESAAATGLAPYPARVRGRAVAAMLAVAVDAWLESDGEADLRDLVAQGIDALTTG